MILITVFVVVPVIALVAAAIAGTAVYGSSCDLSKLQPVAVGENSFIYAADGSVLGAIPAERNRTPVSTRNINPWMAKATVAIEDRRFYEHGGIDPIGIVRAVVADVQGAQDRRGRLDDHAGARPQPLPLARADAEAEGDRGVPRDQARERVVEARGSSPRT